MKERVSCDSECRERQGRGNWVYRVEAFIGLDYMGEHLGVSGTALGAMQSAHARCKRQLAALQAMEAKIEEDIAAL